MDNAIFNEQLQELAGKMQVSVCWPPSAKQPTAEMWNGLFPDLSPKEVYDRFSRVSKDVKLELGISQRPATATFTLRHGCGFGEEKNYMQFTFNPSGTSKLEKAFFKKDHQGKDVVKNYLGTAVELFKEIGMKEMTIGTRNIGGYAWGKYGFVPDTNARWDELKKDISGRMTQDKSAIRFKGKTYPLVPGERAILQKIMDARVADLPTAFPEITSLDRQICNFEDHPITVGKAALVGAQWSGKLSLEDGHPSYERFVAYTNPDRAKAQKVGMLA